MLKFVCPILMPFKLRNTPLNTFICISSKMVISFVICLKFKKETKKTKNVSFEIKLFYFCSRMQNIESIDPKELSLIERVTDVYLNEGMKRITMDDMAKKLTVSKKTLYKYVKNRKELVMKSTQFHVQRQRRNVTEIQERELNPIEEHYQLSRYYIHTISKINPVLHHDMEHYFPEAWEFLNIYFNGFIFESVFKNLKRGQKEGYYHKGFHPEIVAKFFTRRVDMIFDGELFPNDRFSFVDVYLEFLIYHINSITSEKGKKIFSTLDFKQI